MSQWRPQIKTLKEAIKVIEALSANQIMVEYQERDNAVKFPLSALSAIMGVRGGTIQRKWKESPYEVASIPITVGSAGGTMEMGVDTDTSGIVKVYGILWSFLVDATVADRTCRGQIQAEFGLPNCMGVSPTIGNLPYYDITLSASQYGCISHVGKWRYQHSIDNGVLGASDRQFQLPLEIAAGGILNARISANGQTGDQAQIAIIFQEVGKE